MLRRREGRVWVWITGRIKAPDTEGTKEGLVVGRRKTVLEKFSFGKP